ncbi:MAG TPA: hypothetical protein PLQ32_02545 [Flavihumibacter sp.]|nr:hypothetical protein [Bacteroidota bacterium]HOA37236.1 hypothetical protein [Flavihumibacter sp.]HPZ86953.1 hypothetical protein [Flavihumibacter sp.]HQD08304.1 hypothetical protein [Flavihumibacter sp.]
METTTISAKIYLSYENGVVENESFRRKQVFSSAQLLINNRHPFGCLHTWNEEVLAGNASASYEAERNTIDVFIPVVGPFVCRMGTASTLVTPGQLYAVASANSQQWTLSNPYSEAGTLISFIHIGIRDLVNNNENRLLGFDLANTGTSNTLDLGSARFSISRMTGRQVTSYRLTDPSHGLFVYALQGAFEVEGRLLHPGDGLALWNLREAEAEALSGDALICFFEHAYHLSAGAGQ